MSETRALGVGIVGMGFMGRQHLTSYLNLVDAGLPLRVAALADPTPARRRLKDDVDGNIPSGDTSGLRAGLAKLGEFPRAHAEPAELFADPEVQLVSVCTYTESHVPLAIAALEAGKHVVVEKPVALEVGAAEELLAASRAHPEQLCMPALCMRFWPGWDLLARAVPSGEYGAVRSASFRRQGARPGWAKAFYDDASRCGGALFDLHVHDADLVRGAFGAPRAVSSSGSLDELTTRYLYDAPAGTTPIEVSASAAWLDDPDAPFSMGFEVEFEELTLRYTSGKETPLCGIPSGGGTPQPLPVEPHSGYDGELNHAVRTLLGQPVEPGSPAPAALLADAPGLTAMLLRERESLENGGATLAL